MNTRVKSSLILFVVLLIGVAIGFELSEIFVRNKFHRIDEFRDQHGFVRMFENIIKPDANQLPVIDSILIHYHNKLDNISKSGMQQVSLQMDSMIVDLNKILNQDQKSHLKNGMERMKRFPPPPPSGRRPPGPDAGAPPPPPDGQPPEGR
jgi:hypothetical protein